MTGTQGLIAGILMAMALAVYTFWRENAFASQRQKTRLDFLLERKEQLYENLRDLNCEYKAGKFPDAAYQEMKTSLEDEAAAILAEIARLEQAAANAPALRDRKGARV